MTKTEIRHGNKYKIKKPEFAKTFGQGEPPKGIKFNDIFIEYGSIVKADKDETFVSEAKPYNKFSISLLQSMESILELIPSKVSQPKKGE